jgi:hypothetical protein
MKYTTVKISGIITQIAKETEVKGYTEGVLQCFLPDEDNMTKTEEKQWIEKNNKRMEAICNFLNETQF